MHTRCYWFGYNKYGRFFLGSADEYEELVQKQKLEAMNGAVLPDRSHPTFPLLYFANQTQTGKDLLQAAEAEIEVTSNLERLNISKVVL